MARLGLEHFLTTTVAPMFSGAKVEPSAFKPVRRTKTLVVHDGAHTRIRVRQDTDSVDFFVLTRLQKWEHAEIRLVKALVAEFAATDATARAVLPELGGLIVRRAIAQAVARGLQAETIGGLLQTLSSWASQTYEGARVTSGMLVGRTPHEGTDGLRIQDVMAEDFSRVLSDGVGSWWTLGAGGEVVEFTTADHAVARDSDRGFFPIRYQALAAASTSGTVGLALNRNGETLVFDDGQLRFAKRRGRWLHFTHEPVVRQMVAGAGGNKAVRRAVHESCLDAAFARTGACLGIVNSAAMARFRKASLLAPDDHLARSKKLKPLCAARLVDGRRFQALPRLVRKELLALDGAMVLDASGRILAAGAILDVGSSPKGNQGGRSAAARALARFGLGIKVSEDGMISGFRHVPDSEPQRIFEIG